MDPNLIAPVLAGLASLVTLVMTTRRANQTEARADQIEARTAAKETVEALSALNVALLGDISDLRSRLGAVEVRRSDCEHELADLTREHEALKSLIGAVEHRMTQHELQSDE